MKKKTFLFRKASYKKSILKIKPVANKLCLVVNKNNIVSNKLLECCRVTVSRLTRNGTKKWNTQNYKDNLLSFSDVLVEHAARKKHTLVLTQSTKRNEGSLIVDTAIESEVVCF